MQARRMVVIQVSLDQTEATVLDGILDLVADSDKTSGAYSPTEQAFATEWSRVVHPETAKL